MSDVRWAEDSDVYGYQHADGYWAIHVGKHPQGGLVASTDSGTTFKEADRQGYLRRLADLKAEGYLVPERAFTELQAQIEKGR